MGQRIARECGRSSWLRDLVDGSGALHVLLSMEWCRTCSMRGSSHGHRIAIDGWCAASGELCLSAAAHSPRAPSTKCMASVDRASKVSGKADTTHVTHLYSF